MELRDITLPNGVYFGAFCNHRLDLSLDPKTETCACLVRFHGPSTPIENQNEKICFEFPMIAKGREKCQKYEYVSSCAFLVRNSTEGSTMARIRFIWRLPGVSFGGLGSYLLPYVFVILPSTKQHPTEATPVIPVHVLRLFPPQGLSGVINSGLPSPFGCILAKGLDLNRHCVSFLSALSSRKYLKKIHQIPSEQRHELLEKFRTDFNYHSNWTERGSRELEALQMQYNIAQIIATLTPICYLPNELLANILIISVEQVGVDKTTLQEVCQKWRAIVSRLWGTLEVGTWTETKHIEELVKQGPSFLAVVVDTSADEVPSVTSKRPYAALELAWTSTSRWHSLTISSFPSRASILTNSIPFYPHLLFKNLKYLSVGPECDSSDALNELMEVIANTETPNLTSLTFAATVVFQQLDHSHWVKIYPQLKVLVVNGPKFREPIDLLHHFACLETLELSGLTLNPPPRHETLPLLQTLRRLWLKGTSIQWMAGQIFQRLESCTLLQPVDPHSISQEVIISLPLCTSITLQSHLVRILATFHSPVVNNIKVECNQWSAHRANREFDQVWSKRRSREMSQLKVLFLKIICDDTTLLGALQQMPALEELSLDLPHPSALGVDFFAALCARPVTTFAGRTTEEWGRWARYGTKWQLKICFSLFKLEIRYERWLRKGEADVVSPLLPAVAWSRKHSHSPLREFKLKLGDQPTLQLVGVMNGGAAFMHFWGLIRGEPWTESAQRQGVLQGCREDPDLLCRTPHSQESVLFRSCLTAPIARFIGLHSDSGSFPFESIPFQFYSSFFNHLRAFHHHPLQPPLHPYHILPFFKHLEELSLSNFIFQPCHSARLPLSRTLRILHICDTPLDWMDGQIFKRLVDCRIGLYNCERVGELSRVEMPSCTKMEFAGCRDPCIMECFRLPSLNSLLLVLSQKEKSPSYSATIQSILLLARSIRPRVLRICMKPEDQNIVETLRSNLGNGVAVELFEDGLVEDFGWGAVETDLRWRLQ